MRARNGAGAGSVEHDARLLIVLAGKRDDHTVSPHSHKTQLKFPRSDFAAQLVRACGPRLARPGWTRFILSGGAP